jgi:hypothetical protein
MPAGAGLSLAGATAEQLMRSSPTAGVMFFENGDVKTENPIQFTKAAAQRFLLLARARQGRKDKRKRKDTAAASSTRPTHVLVYISIHNAGQAEQPLP